jgi:TRAP-type mannitol/chloroaromatic compound transport system permease small subunit
MDTIAKYIEIFNETLGKITSILAIPLVIVVVYEVFMRYVIESPTAWAFEMTAFLYGVHFMLGLGFTLGRDGHVKVDVLTQRLRPKTQALISIISYVVIFLPVWIVMGYAAIKYAYTSTAMLELNATSWAPPIWPLKILMAVGYLALLAEGVARLFRSIETFRGLDTD